MKATTFRKLGYIAYVVTAIMVLLHLKDWFAHMGGYSMATMLYVLWILAPSVNVMMIWASRDSKNANNHIHISFLFLVVTAYYALNGLVEQEQGAQHMHLIIIPFIYTLAYLVLLILDFAPCVYKRCKEWMLLWIA